MVTKPLTGEAAEAQAQAKRDFDLVGFAVTPTRPLKAQEKELLDLDMSSLLASLAFPPPGIVDLAFDLRYLAKTDDSITGKQLTVVLLCRLNFDPGSDLEQKVVITGFEREFLDLLRLHLDPYGYRVTSISTNVWPYSQPFPIEDYVEITRRITSLRPLRISRFQGRSPMSRAVDMLLRQRSQICLSIYLEPHPLSPEESRELEAFGYETDLLGEDRDLRDIRSLLGADGQGQAGTTTPFRVSLRIASEQAISQYLINLIGSEISGRRDYTFFRPQADQLELARSALHNVEFFTTNGDPALAEIPVTLRSLAPILPVGEAQAAFRLPTERIATSRERTFETYPAPVANLPKRGLLIGEAEHPSHPTPLPVRLQDSDRRRHVYIVGKTGTGKSMLLLNSMIQDLENGSGLCLVDPHGDLVNTLVKHIPPERASDVVIFDPADPEFVAGLNFLEPSVQGDAAERDFLVQEVIATVMRMVDYDIAMYGPVGQQMTRVACETLMALDPPATLIEVPLIFSSHVYRRTVLERVTDPDLQRWWAEEWERKTEYQKQELLGWFTSKFQQFASAPQVRNVVGQTRSSFRVKELMDENKILLANLSRGRLGALNSSALGGMLVSKVLWAATRRAWDEEEDRNDFYLYVDEFQNFITDSFETILSEARKYRLNLIVAHQHLGQLRAMGHLSNRIERAVFGNIGTMVTFRVGTDATRLSEEMGDPVEAHTLRSLENRYAVSQLLVDDVPTVPFTMRTVDYQSPEQAAEDMAKEVYEEARRRNRPVIDVDDEIRRRHQVEGFD